MAVVVSGVVGVAAPVITWRAGVSGQRAASNDTRVRDDLAELRSSLDRALADFIVLRDRMESEIQEYGRLCLVGLTAAEAKDQLKTYTNRHNVARSAYFKAAADGARLRIRLGEDTAYSAYAAAVSAYREASRYMVTNTGSKNSTCDAEEVDVVQRDISGVDAALKRFEASAYQLVSSRLR